MFVCCNVLIIVSTLFICRYSNYILFEAFRDTKLDKEDVFLLPQRYLHVINSCKLL